MSASKLIKVPTSNPSRLDARGGSRQLLCSLKGFNGSKTAIKAGKYLARSLGSRSSRIVVILFGFIQECRPLPNHRVIKAARENRHIHLQGNGFVEDILGGTWIEVGGGAIGGIKARSANEVHDWVIGL
jgi:hypothetical protein